MTSEDGSEVARALARIEHVIRTKSPLGSLTILVWAAMTHVVDLLNSVFYLAFRGRTGAGKGTAIESCVILAPRATLLSVVSPAFLASALGEGRTIGITEADKLLAKDPIVAKLLRDGYRRGASYGLMVPAEDGNGWVEEERSIFGPKVFDFHQSLDTHLLGRTIVLDMDRDDSVDRAMDAEKKARILAPVHAWLAASAAEAKLKWNADVVDKLWDDSAFRREVERMGGASGRDHIIAATMLLVAKIYGWEYDEEVRRIIRSRKTVDEWGEESEVADAVGDIAGANPRPELEIPTDALLQHVNERRAKAKLPSLTPRHLGGILADLGFREGSTYVRAKAGANRDRRVILPYDFLTVILPAQAAHPAQTSLEGPHRRDGEADSGAVGPVGPDGQATWGGRAGDAPQPPDGPEEHDGWDSHVTNRTDRARSRLEREDGRT